jgi:DNA-directed RNA polymerase subunit RPC12/RpoP
MPSPDTTAAPPGDVHRFPCPACGADLRFNPGAGQLVCDHCGHTEPMAAPPPATRGGLRELDFRAAVANQLPAAELEETRGVTCTNCGAQFEFDRSVHAAECPFCATPVVTDTGPQRHIKPRGVIPFALDEAQARSAMTQWLDRLWFAPSGLTDYARKGRRMQGIYVPYWTFDADTTSQYRGERGTVYYETETVTVTRNGRSERETRQVAKVRWSPAAGRVARFFDDVLVLASRSLPKRFTDALAPWDLTALTPYAPEFVAGFRAEGYTVELDEGFAEARQIMDAQIERDIRFDIGGDRQRIHAVDTDVRDITFKHVLLPVWLAAYKYNGKTFRFVVNGQTGRVQGERPWSAWKITAAVILGLILAGAVGYLAALQEGG